MYILANDIVDGLELTNDIWKGLFDVWFVYLYLDSFISIYVCMYMCRRKKPAPSITCYISRVKSCVSPQKSSANWCHWFEEKVWRMCSRMHMDPCMSFLRPNFNFCDHWLSPTVEHLRIVIHRLDDTGTFSSSLEHLDHVCFPRLKTEIQFFEKLLRVLSFTRSQCNS